MTTELRGNEGVVQGRDMMGRGCVSKREEQEERIWDRVAYRR